LGKNAGKKGPADQFLQINILLPKDYLLQESLFVLLPTAIRAISPVMARSGVVNFMLHLLGMVKSQSGFTDFSYPESERSDGSDRSD
jgi:hypothetical protein